MKLPRPSLSDHRVRLPLIVAAIVGAYFLLKALLPDIDLQQLLDDVSETLGNWTYVVVGVMAFLETGAFVGLVAPGETFVILAGAVAGQGTTSVYVTIAVVWASAWAGDTASFTLGQRKGRSFMLRHGRRVRITPERISQVEGYFRRHGGKTILVGRFVGLVRALAPFIAGSSGMAYRQFVPYSIIGTGLWASAFTLIGYFAAQSIDTAAEYAGRGTFLFATFLVAVFVIVSAIRYLRDPENRQRLARGMDENRVLHPLVTAGRWVQPQARFLWGRLTPGGLGLEFTTLIAVLSVSLYVLVAYTVVFSGDPGTTAADRAAIDVVDELRRVWLTDLNEVLTELGSGAVVLPLALLVAVALGVARRWSELAVLVAAMVIIFVGVDVLKEAVDRPRPSGALASAPGNAFPSGHAAHSTLYVWLAVTIVVRLRPGLTYATAIVVAGIAVTAAVGLTRVYLGVHYITDVFGGWALGISAFAGCATVALVVTHLRKNWRSGGGGGGDSA
jgi:membrane protein DedA with SNARE-associated domain/membrane-associated phospholipid phosphatase